jgi:hypothetical protein
MDQIQTYNDELEISFKGSSTLSFGTASALQDMRYSSSCMLVKDAFLPLM